MSRVTRSFVSLLGVFAMALTTLALGQDRTSSLVLSGRVPAGFFSTLTPLAANQVIQIGALEGPDVELAWVQQISNSDEPYQVSLSSLHHWKLQDATNTSVAYRIKIQRIEQNVQGRKITQYVLKLSLPNKRKLKPGSYNDRIFFSVAAI